MNSILQDIRFGLRMMWKSPGFTLVAVLTLALGIGANTAIFTVVNAAMIRPLPYPNARRLMVIFHSYKKLNLPRVTVSPSSYDFLRTHSSSFEQMAAFTGFQAPQNLTGTGEPEQVRTIKATGNFFTTLGTRPMLGRTFAAQEDSPGAARVAVLGYGLWNERFGGDRGVVGREITLDGANYTVIGVMPKGFEYPQKAQLWVPIAFTPEQLQDGVEYLQVIGTVRSGVSFAQAEAEMAKLTHDVLVRDNEEANTPGFAVNTLPMQAESVSEVRAALWVLLGAVGCVLLIACANIANLLLARAAARSKEIAIRVALGASRWRVSRQLLVEGVLLAIFGGAVGLLLGYAGLDPLLKLVPAKIPSDIRMDIDATVLAFTFGLAIITGLVFSALPALQIGRGDVNDILKEGGRSSGTGRHVARSTIVVVQLAAAMVLLISAGLLIKTFIRIQQSDPGFEPRGILTFRTQLPELKYKQPAQITAFFDQVLERERTVPGVVSAALTSSTPLTTSWTSNVNIEGKTFTVPAHVHVTLASADYFKTMEIPVQSGRAFTDADRDGSLPVAIIDQNTVNSYFQGEDPIGKKVMFTFEGTEQQRIWRQVIGVVGSVKHTSPLEHETKGEVFLPFAQHPIPSMIVTLRTAGDPLIVADNARRQVLSVDPQQPVTEIRTMDDVLNDFVAQPRFNMVLLGGFAMLAVILSAIGIYGVIAYSVTQRTHEFGVRMALGATTGNVLRFVLGQAFRLALVGLVIGITGSLIATRALSSLLFGVSATDPSTYAAIAALIACVALLASYIPARRATKVDPMIALRYE